MAKILIACVLLVCLFAHVALSMYWPTQQQTQSCIATGGMCEQFNILLQCCPGLVCMETVMPGVKTVFTEFRCKPEMYIPGQYGGYNLLRGQGREEE